MRFLQLYPEVPKGPLTSAEPRAPSPDCRACPHGAKAQHVAIRPEGVIGGTFYVSGHPDGRSDETGRPFNGLGGSFLRKTLTALGETKQLFGYALSCKPAGDVEAEHLKACAGHLKWAIQRAKPRRIVALDPTAAEALLGDRYQPLSARKGYGWFFDDDGLPIPVFFLIPPEEAAQNSLYGRAFREDLTWALAAKPACLPMKRGLGVRVIETLEDAELAAAELSDRHVYMDTETSGLLHTEGFRDEAVCVWADGAAYGYVWPRRAIERPELADSLHRVLALAECSGFNIKYDMQACACDPKVGPIAKMRSDARIKRKLVEADAQGSLDDCARLVGLGGHKHEAEAVVDAICAELTKLSVAEELTPTGRKRPKPVCAYVDPLQLQDGELQKIRDGASPKSFAYRWIPNEILWRYVGRDVFATIHVDRWADARLTPGQWRIWDEVSRPALLALADMETAGLPIDVGMLESLNIYFVARVAEALKVVQSYFPDLNPASPQQVLAAVTSLGIKLKPQKGVLSTNDIALSPFAEKFPFVNAVLEYRRLSKLHKTYGVGLRRALRPDGRVHTSFLLDGTECMPAGELVLTNRGYLTVEDVRLGDAVITHLGRPRKVVGVSRHAPTSIYKVHLSNGLVLRTTGNHQYWDGADWSRADCLIAGDTIAVHGFKPEEWRVCHEFKNYSVSSWGRVRNHATGQFLAQQPKGEWGHLKVALKRNGARNRGTDFKDFAVHQLVLRAFSDPPEGKVEVRHRNGIAWDNQLSNLEWGTSKENKADARAHGTMSHRKTSAQTRLTDGLVNLVRKIPRSELNDREVADALGVSRKLICDVRLGKRWMPETHIEGKSVKFLSAKVVRVEILEEEETYGLSVEEDESHVTGGIVTHNTGRPSSTDPNVMNIPRNKDAEGNEDGKLIRDCVCAPPGRGLVEGDYSQLEIREACYLSGDDVMTDLLCTGQDFHQQAADLMGLDRSSAKCFHPDTEVLTRTGWKRITALAEGEEVMQAIPEAGAPRFEWVVPLEVFSMQHPSGKLVHLKSKGIDLRVTPDHRMLEWKRNNREFQVVMPEAFGKGTSWAGAGYFAGGEQRQPFGLLRLAVATQADGHYAPDGSIRFGFTRGRKIVRMRELLAAANIPYTEHLQPANAVTAFRIPREPAAAIKTLLDGKHLPWSWLGLNRSCREAVVEEAAHWDAHVAPEGRRYSYSQATETSLDVLQALAVSVGRRTAKRFNLGMWTLSVMDRPLCRGTEQTMRRDVEDYDGPVACLSVPSTFVLVRDGGIPVVTGQTTVFAVLYELPEMLGFLVAKRLKVSTKRGNEIADAMFGKFKRLKAWMMEQLAAGNERGGMATTWMGQDGRFRPLWHLASHQEFRKGQRENAMRSTWNGAVQGSAADKMTSSLWPINQALRKEVPGAFAVLTVYDSVMAECNEGDEEKVARVMARVLLRFNLGRVPLAVEFKKGKRWGSMTVMPPETYTEVS